MDAKKVALYFSFVLLFVLASIPLVSYWTKQSGIYYGFMEFVFWISHYKRTFAFLSYRIPSCINITRFPLACPGWNLGESHGILFAATCGTLALVANCFWTYWVARIFGLTVINRFILFLRKKPLMIPEDGKNSNYLVWSLVMRLTPGIPFIFTNTTLGALKMPFKLYTLVSVPILTLSSFGYIYATAGIIGGNFVHFGSGIAIILCFFIVGRLILKKRKNAV